MKEVWKAAFAGVSSVLIYLVGGLDIALQALLVFIVIDYLTGLGKGYVSSTLNSQVGLKGIVKKLGILSLVVVATLLDRMMGDSGLIRTVIIYYLAANEGLSILENLGAMTVVVPEFLKNKLEQLTDSAEKGDIHEDQNRKAS